MPSFDAYAGDINDHGVVVGTMRAGGAVSPWHAWIYADGVVTNLNSRIPAGSGLHLAYASGINNAGQIVGTAYDSRGSYHAFLLTPVEAGTPVVNIADASVVEGHSGAAVANLTVTLSAASSSAGLDFLVDGQRQRRRRQRLPVRVRDRHLQPPVKPRRRLRCS